MCPWAWEHLKNQLELFLLCLVKEKMASSQTASQSQRAKVPKEVNAAACHAAMAKRERLTLLSKITVIEVARI